MPEKEPQPPIPLTQRRMTMGQGQQIPNKLLMRQDEDTDNEPANTEGEDFQREDSDMAEESLRMKNIP